MEQQLAGRVWKFGDNVSTELMLPATLVFPVKSGRIRPEETVPFCMSANRPGWHALVRPGDIVAAGANFGSGSSRPAYIPLRAMGIQAVVAETVSRLFYRTCVNSGFLVIRCPGITTLVEEGDDVEIDLGRGVVRNRRSGRSLSFPQLPEDSPPAQIIRSGGLIPYMKARLGLRADRKA